MTPAAALAVLATAAPASAERLIFESTDRIPLEGAVQLAWDGSRLLVRRDEPDRVEAWAWSPDGRLSERAKQFFAPDGGHVAAIASAAGVTALAYADRPALVVLGSMLTPIRQISLRRAPAAVALSADGALLAAALDTDAPTLVAFRLTERSDDAPDAEPDWRLEASSPAPPSTDCLDGTKRPAALAFDSKGERLVATYPGLNAFATWNLESGSAQLICLGFKDWATSAFDASDADHGVAIRSWPVRGAFQPTGLAVLETPMGGLVATANQGEISDPEDAARVARLNLDPGAFPNADVLQREDRLGRLRVRMRGDDLDGDGDHDRLTAFGARSLALWAWRGDLVGETGAEIETHTAQVLGVRGFNIGAETNRFDARSDDMGPEPNAVAVADLKGRAYAFVTLAQTGGVIAFDVTMPDAPSYAGYARAGGDDRPWAETVDHDRGPSDIVAVTEGEIIKIAVANAVSGAVTTYVARTP